MSKKGHFIQIPFFKISKYIYILSQTIFFTNFVYAQEDVTSDDNYIPIFRSGHHLSILYSPEYSTWTVSQIQGLVAQERVSPISKSAMNSGFFVRYMYHINIVNNFGFFIGTTAGFFLEMGSYGNLKQSYGLAFPTLLGGLVLNLGQNFRLLGGAEYGAIWYPEMTITTDSGSKRTLSPVPDMYSIFGGIDYFFSKNKAFTFQIGWRGEHVTTLNNGSNATYLNTLSIDNNSYFAQIGLTVQIGDINQAINSVLPIKTD